MNSPLLAIYCLLGFIWLSYASLHQETGYTQSAFSVLPPDKPSFTQRQAAALKDLYNISDEDIAKPIVLW